MGCFSGANRINASDFRKLTFAKKKEGQFVDDFLSMNSVFLLVFFGGPFTEEKDVAQVVLSEKLFVSFPGS